MPVPLHRHTRACTWLAPLLLLLLGTRTKAKGGEKATLTLPPFDPIEVNHRQDFCTRYQALLDINNGAVNLTNALSGTKIHPVIQYGPGFKYFNYTPEGGIDPEYPGIVANILDYVAERGNFTWRDSFAVYSSDDKGPNRTWNEMIVWASDTYDLSVDKWAKTTGRLEEGIAFCEPWFDGSFIMIDNTQPPIKKSAPRLDNWLRPFSLEVWLMVAATLVLSSLVYQFLESVHGEQEERSKRRWFMDNLYLSSINFTQNYVYEPRTLAGRLFGVSFAFWAMLIGATYTANLASLLVDRPNVITPVADINDAIKRQMTFCTHETSASEVYVEETFGTFLTNFPRKEVAYMYDSLNNGECDLIVGTLQEFEEFKTLKRYNPTCDLEFVGRKIKDVDASFVTKVDPGVKCSGLVNEVFNYYLSAMKDGPFFADQWDAYNQLRAQKENVEQPDFSCSVGDVGSSEGRRRLSSASDAYHWTRRRLQGDTLPRILRGAKSGGAVGGAVAAGEDGGSEDSLTANEMAGTFVLHLAGCLVAVAVALASRVEKRVNVRRHSSKNLTLSEEDSLRLQIDSMSSQMGLMSNQIEMILTKLDKLQGGGEENTFDGGQPGSAKVVKEPESAKVVKALAFF